MMPDDESVLSAYFDDELDAESRVVVDARLDDDPALAGRLGDFADLRAAVSGLPRPEAPCRLASAVLARVEASESMRSRRPYYWVATAASLAFGCLLMLRSGLIARPPAPVEVVAAPPVGPGPDEADDSADPASEPIPIRPLVVDRLGPAPDPEDGARRGLVRLLGGRGLGRILVAADSADEPAAARVEELLRGTARKNPEFVRVTVAPGLAIDPEHPEGGEAFVAVMDDLERREFLVKLAKAFPRVVHEPATAPGPAGQLADLQGITLGTGPSAAGLKPPPPEASVAIHQPPPIDVQSETERTELPPAVPRLPGDPLKSGEVVVQPDEPDDAEGAGAAPGPATGARPTGLAPVIIWVSDARGSRPGR